MKIVFLDAKTIGDDIDLSGFDSLGEVTKYNFTTPEEAPERVKDADVLIINKVPINENTVGTAKNLKLVCVLQPEPTIWIKTIWIPTKLPGETLPVIPQKQLLSIHLPCFSICLKSCAITMIM